jgi:hypothetical protein
MGVHYPNTALIGFVPNVLPRTGTDPNIDPLHPDVLVYEPQPNGRMRLVAVEYMVFQAAWQAAHPQQPVPSMFGVPFNLRTHGWRPHYELHLWLWRENPNGLTAVAARHRDCWRALDRRLCGWVLARPGQARGLASCAHAAGTAIGANSTVGETHGWLRRIHAGDTAGRVRLHERLRTQQSR